MTLKQRFGLSVLLFFVAAVVVDAEIPKKGKVALSLPAGDKQPANWPIIVDVTVTNVGNEDIFWWCGGPDKYPPAQLFEVEVRYGSETKWHKASPSNGQYVVGSGSSQNLTPGNAIIIPIAVPIDLSNFGDTLAEQVDRVGGVTIRVSARDWVSDTVETYLKISDKQEYMDRRRARVINAITNRGAPFWRHVGERYPDTVVLDAMLKLVTVDCAPITTGSAQFLACQPELPKESGAEFALLVKRWVPRSPSPEWYGLREDIIAAALKTQSELAREAVLDMLRDNQNERTRWLLIRALQFSPGDHDWLTHAREAILDLGKASPDDEKLAQEINRSTKHLNSRLKNEKQKSIANKAIEATK